MDGIAVELAECEQHLKQRKSNISVIETETGSIDVRVEHLREELNKAINDKQYSALLAEMNTLKEQRKAFENEELIEMTACDELNANCEDINSRIEERKKVMQVAECDLKTREEEISEQLAELEGERKVAASVIPEAILVDFDELAEDYDGETMAAIEIIDKKRREYSCTSCSLHLPLESVTTLMGNKDSIVICGSCDRILYLEDASREALAPSE
tara:strand:+ start:1168 stop:1812 length:645 start_codon:yes stop_codon:yes gene_type:complete